MGYLLSSFGALSPPVSKKRASLAIPIAAQIAKYPSPRAVARGRDLREPQNMAGRSKGGRDRAPEKPNDELREKVSHSVFLRLFILLRVG